MVQDLVHNLCESLVENIGGVAGIGKKTPPTPITYLTQWKIVGNSEVHTLPYPDGVVLPNGYKRCEYLESDGIAYIELPITFTSASDSIVIKAAIKTVTDWKGFIAPKTWIPIENKRFIMGSCVSKDNKHLWSPAFGSNGQGNKFFTSELEADTDVHTWSYNNNTFIIDDVYTAEFGTANFTTDDIRIFYGYNTPFASKIYDYHHIKADAEYHLIPCLDSNNTPCMYDVINNQAYYNSASSGSFTYELYPQPTEIWSCGEYNATDGKYHILVQPQGGSIADIALDEPLRKVNDVADTIEFPSGTEGKALVTRNLMYDTLDDKIWVVALSRKLIVSEYWRPYYKVISSNDEKANILVEGYTTYSRNSLATQANKGVAQSAGSTDSYMCLYDNGYIPESGNTPTQTFYDSIVGKHILLELATPTTELVDAPQIEEAESYTCVISQGGKAVSWSSFETE